jgi:Flp pilus assembly protein TadG
MMRALKSEAAGSAIEFALVAPILVVLCLGLVGGWSMVSFMTNMRAGVSSGANLYLQGAGDDTLVREAALENWQNRPSDAQIAIARTYRCGTEIAEADDICIGSQPSPSIEVTITASGTWDVPFDIAFFSIGQELTHAQTVRIR